MNNSILIVDDNEKIRRSLSRNLEQYGYVSHLAGSGKEAVDQLSSNRVDVVLLDVVLENESGLDILTRIKAIDDRIPVVIITGYASIETAVRAIKNGAYDYLQKPLDLNKLMKVIENAIKLNELGDENRELRKRLGEYEGRIITSNAKMLELCEMARKIASTDLPILIVGENGTGKEVLADFIHMNSGRSAKEFLKINCASFPESLLDNELFGHEKGSYTGADSCFRGIFERADGGTLFLDEIGDMSLSIQAKILRTIQNSEIRRIGGSANVKVDVRFVAATNRDLERQIANGDFREDLFYRLNIALFEVPPLRERREDIVPLAEYFLKDVARQRGRPPLRLSREVLEIFSAYDWPGNVRELKNVIHYASAIASSCELGTADLPGSFLHGRSPAPASPRVGNIREEAERNLILRCLHESGGNKTEAAKALDMSRKTLYDKLRKYAIPID
jgi:DNA-binding NtrC family response regulator